MKKLKNEIVESRDIYEIAYFLTKTACRIEKVKVVRELDKPTCIVMVSGPKLKQLQLDYLNNRAPVDAVSYRKSLSYVRNLVYGEINKLQRQGGAG